MNKIINWKRFWCKRSGNIYLTDNGFLYDPESEYAKYYNNDVVAFESIQNIPCLILLGEPGSGKTNTLNSEFNLLKSKITDNTDILEYKNLNEYGDETRFINEIFESDIIKNWKAKDLHLHLWLDSFDECLMVMSKLPIIFRNRIKLLKDYKDRISLRVSCRTGEWPERLTQEFNSIWGEENVGIYELCSLRRKDVEKAANENQINASNFIEIIEKKEIQPLAITPLTLNFLINEFQQHNTLPDTKTKLYIKGCEHLASENNPERNYSKSLNYLSPARRLAIASRIAALMVFCNRNSIITKSNEFYPDSQTLMLSDIGEGEETCNDEKFSFNERDVVETITQTSLFTGRGPNKFGFAHQSYLEFLAAQYIAQHQITLQQIKSLIQVPNDPEQKIIPQFSSTVAWLNSIDSKIIEESIKNDPLAILEGDIESLEMKYRKALVESLLSQFEQLKILDHESGIYRKYEKLNHPELSSQLRPYIIDKQKHFLVRRVAIDIARECKVMELQKLLADTALNDSEDINIRNHAALAVAVIADDDSRLKLKPLAVEPQSKDVNDELKGAALQALWPEILTTQETFNSLTPQKCDNLIGNYARFLIEIPELLTTKDFPIALRWVKENKEDDNIAFSRYEELTKSILFQAWNHLMIPEILDAFVEAIIPRLENYKSICPIHSTIDKKFIIPELPEKTRKNLISTIVNKIKTYKIRSLTHRLEGPRIIFDNDLDWLINELNLENDENKKEIWAQIVYDKYSRSENPEHINLILNEMNNSPVLNKKFKSSFEAIFIDSEQAKKMRENYLEYQEWEKEDEQRLLKKQKKIVPSVHERIKSYLDRFENVDSNAWWQLCREMTLEDTSEYYVENFDSDLINQPGWSVCDENTKNRIIEAAKKYIVDNSISTILWAEDNQYYRPALAGYKAFILLKKLDQQFLDKLESNVWKRWASVIIGYPENTAFTDHDKTYLTLIEQAYLNAPQEIINATLTLIDRENKQFDHLSSLNKIKSCLDERMQNALFEKLKDNSLKAGCFQDILSLLISLTNSSAINYAESLLKLPIRGEEVGKVKAAALSLILNANESSWDNIWKVIQSDINFGEEVFLLVQKSIRGEQAKDFLERIGEKNIANLFIWLYKNLSKAQDKNESDQGWLDEYDNIKVFRNSLLQYLENIGTVEAIEALEYIKKEMPELNYLDFCLIKARENMRRKNWTPLQPAEFLSLIRNSNKRIILTADHLVEILIESLNHLENKLQGETPLAFTLWDMPKNKNCEPKSEKYLSDYVKQHLEDDLVKTGVMSIREVEISNKQGDEGKSGEEIDIYVSYFISSKQEKAKVMIEVKGCWNPKVKTDMKNQLLDRYLDKPALNHGIYLVGWYMCKQWEISKNKTGVKTLEEARKIFYDQSVKLSNNQKTIRSFVLNCALRSKDLELA